MKTIANGASRINEISIKIDKNSSKVNKYLQVLIHLQMLCQTLSENLHLKRFAWNI